MYWAEATKFLPIAETLPRYRFDKINYFHVNDNSKIKPREDSDYDKLFKVMPFIDRIKENSSHTEAEEYNSVDELIIPLREHSSLKQYVKKPHKWGIKVFAHAGSSGIVYDFEIYRGKGIVRITSSLGICGNIVMRFVEGLPKNQNYKVFTDNWFTSYSLNSVLKDVGILSVGTVRVARLPRCNLKTDPELKRQGRGSDDYRTEAENVIAQ
jgi:hypothetical protein